jgi:hypothetical protein
MSASKIPINLVMILFSVYFASCCSSKENTELRMIKNKIDRPISIPPGTADIKAEIINIIDDEENYLLKLRIIDVIRYGAGTSPLPQGTKIEAYIPKALFENEPNKIKSNELIFVRVSEVKAMGDRRYWEIIMFINKNK